MIKRVDRVYAVTIGLLLAAYVGLFIRLAYATAIHVPQFDMLGWLLRYVDYWHRGERWTYLWMPYDEHRLVWSLLLVVADVQWFGGTTVPFFLFDSACWTAAVVGLLWAAWRTGGEIELRTTRAAAVVFLLAASPLVITCSFPIYGCMAQTTGFLVVALVLYRFAETRRMRAAAIASAVLASFGTAAGLAAPFLLVWLARRRRDSPRWVLSIGLIAVALAVVYIPWATLHSDAVSLTTYSPLRAADFVVRFFGLPWSRVPWLLWPGRVIGFVILLLSVCLAVRSLRIAESSSPLHDVALALILFALCTAAMLSLGRVWRNPTDFIPIRYAFFAAMGQTGVALIAIDSIWPAWQRLHSTSRLVVVTAIAMAFLAQQIVAGRSMIGIATPFKMKYRAFVTGVWTPDMAEYIYPDRDEAYRALAFMKSHALYQGPP
jgi:hypothetical protein